MADTEDLKSSELNTHVGSSPTSGKSGIRELKYSLHFSLYCIKCRRNRSFIAHKIYKSEGSLSLMCHHCRSGYKIFLTRKWIERIEEFPNEFKFNEENRKQE